MSAAAKSTPGPWEADSEAGVFMVCSGADVVVCRGIKSEADAHLLSAARELSTAVVEMLEAWEEQFGEGACDCQPEPQNFGHVCQCCKARSAIAKSNGSASRGASTKGDQP